MKMKEDGRGDHQLHLRTSSCPHIHQQHRIHWYYYRGHVHHVLAPCWYPYLELGCSWHWSPTASHATCLPLRKVYVVIFTACGDFCGGFHHKSKSPHILVVVFATSPNHHKYFWRKPLQVQITTNPVATSICGHDFFSSPHTHHRLYM